MGQQWGTLRRSIQRNQSEYIQYEGSKLQISCSDLEVIFYVNRSTDKLPDGAHQMALQKQHGQILTHIKC